MTARVAPRLAAVAVAGALTCAAGAPAVFRLEPVRPVAELRREALAARPPQESGKRIPDLVEIVSLDPTIRLDIRYAGSDNLLGTALYTQARAFMQRPAAEALVRAHRALGGQGYGILVYDAYRPWYVSWILWEATPLAERRRFVADPAKGSSHNRGCAVDVTLYELASGRIVEMPNLYDEMSERAARDYAGGTATQRRRRDLLRTAMEREGFTVYVHEWWHFAFRGCARYPILNVRFEDLGAPGSRRTEPAWPPSGAAVR